MAKEKIQSVEPNIADLARGVATKYLSNYLVWNNFVNYSKEAWSEKQQILKRFVFTTTCTTPKRMAV